MKKHPVIRFLPDLFARVLDGSKTQTRLLDEKWASVMPGDLLWAEEDGTGRRVLIEAADNRRQHIQEITHEDAITEGVECYIDDGAAYYGPFNNGHASPVVAFSWLWDSINGKRASWASNPEVSAISFRRAM